MVFLGEIDAVIDQPMDKILKELPLSSQIKHALVDAKGRLAGYIALVQSYETGQWDKVSRLSQALKLDDTTSRRYICKPANGATSPLKHYNPDKSGTRKLQAHRNG